MRAGVPVSNIPTNIVASVLGTTTLQRQAASAIDREKQIAARAQKIQFQQSLRHSQEIEDPADDALEAVQDRHQKGEGQEKKRHRDASAEVEIEGVEAAPPVEKADEPPRGLDISA